MSDIVARLLETLNAHPELGGLITFVISTCESIAIIGTIVPGTITMTAIGALAGSGIIPLWSTLFWATMGAIVGDGISYWIGHHFKERLHRVWPFRTHPELLRTGERFFHKHGGLSVFIGRFVGPVRALVPLVAGMLGMRPIVFYVANIASAILWAPAYMLPGVMLGAAATELPPDIALHVMMALILMVLLALLVLWFIYKLFRLIHKQTDQFKNYIWRLLKKSRYFSVATIILKHHDDKKTHGQLRLAIYFIVVSILFSLLVIYIKSKGPAAIMVNDALYHLFRGIRTPGIDSVMMNISLLGQKQVVLPAAGILFIYLILSKRFWTALHLFALAFLGAGAVYVIKNVIRSPRPWGIAQSPETFSFPSGHTTLATIVFMGLAFLIAASFHPKRRYPFYLIGAFIAFLVGTSRVYLGAHWFTDVLGGWLLSIAILMVVIISFRRHQQRFVNPVGTLIVSVLAISVVFTGYHYTHIEKMQAAYAQIDWPRGTVTQTEWWEKNHSVPGYRVSLFGFPSQKINIEWVGKIDTIRQSLMQQGWSKPPARDWVSSVHRLADISSTQYLPMVSPQYLDKRPALILTREVTDAKNIKRLLVIRLWDAHRTIKENDQTLWVGVVSLVPSTYSWLYQKHPADVVIEPSIIFPQNLNVKLWLWKIIEMDQSINHKKAVRQKIMLIREKK